MIKKHKVVGMEVIPEFESACESSQKSIEGMYGSASSGKDDAR